MAGDIKKDYEKLRKGVKDIAKSSPAIAIGRGIAKIGDKVIKAVPKDVRKRVHSGARKFVSRLRGTRQSQRIKRHQQYRKKASGRK